ncbi:hypothetical protein SAMN05444280_13022 [Tangfeifania diversioriginum]|uniref:Uncharacterized protein n=1 Tax=Tangfeifania diversioriginum TaxID=1168035 RepID=A0A1M6M512_9BACT|nr:hypothetical protein SAMN05444280_13022 [Tangfeifania diversioriginum]
MLIVWVKNAYMKLKKVRLAKGIKISEKKSRTLKRILLLCNTYKLK